MHYKDAPRRMQPKDKVGFRTHFTALDGFRAIAVTLVFMEHYGGGSHGSFILRWFNSLRQFGSAGVGMFFVLSGFLITGILYDTREDPHYFKNFYIRRSLRIFPIFYLVLLVCLLLTPILHYHLQWGHLSFPLYLGNIFANWNWSLYELNSPTHPALSINLGHFWSLFVEEQFYLIWPVVVFLVKDRRKLLKLAFSIIVLVLLARIGMVFFLPFDVAERFGFRMLPTRADDLLIGGVLALLLRGPNAERWLKRSSSVFWGGLISIAALGTWRHTFGFYDPYMLSVGMDCVSIGSAGLIGLSIQPKTLASRTLSVPMLRRIGLYSYGFYIYHLLLEKGRLMWLVWCEQHFHSLAIAGLLTAVPGYLLTLLLACLSYELYEKRFLCMKSRFDYVKH